MKPSEHAIEDWAKMVLSKPKRNLTGEEARTLILTTLAQREIDSDKEICETLEKKQAGFLTSMFWWRVKCCHTYEITPSLCAYIGECVIKNPGMSTMMANYLQYVAHEHRVKKIGLKEFGLWAFPYGFPTDESWEELWDSQKIDLDIRTDKKSPYYNGSDNILDYPKLYQTIAKI